MAEHVASRLTYFLVFGALVVLTVLTWGVAQFNLGPLNDVVALVIAVTKATLVILFFMHVAHSSRLTKLTVVASFFWLAILLGLTLSDYLSRPASNAFRGIPSTPVVGETGDGKGGPAAGGGVEQDQGPAEGAAPAPER